MPTTMTQRTLYIIGAALIAASLVVRIVSYPVVSADYTTSLSHWMDALRGSPGLSAFASPFSDYPPLYLYLLKLISLLPGYDLFWIKSLSLLFDIVLALSGALIVSRVGAMRERPLTPALFFVVAASIFTIPTVIMNSSLWGQCDAIYASFVLFSLYFMLGDRPVPATIMFAVAISLKLQAIFFLPIFVGYILLKRQAWTYLLAVPVIFVITLIPAALSGGSFGNLFFTYAHQAAEFSDLSLNAPSVFALFDPHTTGVYGALISTLGYIVAAGAALLILVQCLRCFTEREDAGKRANQAVFLALAAVLIIPYFLPHMHERYFYLADVLSLIYAWTDPKRWFVPLIVIVSSTFAYLPFLSSSVPWFGGFIMSLGIFSVLLFMVIVSFMPHIVRVKNLPFSRHYARNDSSE